MEDNKAEKIQNLVDSENVKEYKTENLRYRIWESVKKDSYVFLAFCFSYIFFVISILAG